MGTAARGIPSYRYIRALAAGIVAATLISACATKTASPAPVPAPSGPTQPAQSAPSAPTGSVASSPPTDSRGRGGRGGGNGSSTTATGGLPADWPADLPVPSGQIIGATGSNGHWSVLVLAAGSAAEVHRSAVAFYTAAGFTPATDSVLNKGNRQITLVVENRDHSNTETNLAIAVTTR